MTWFDNPAGRMLRRVGALAAAGGCALALSLVAASPASASVAAEAPLLRSIGSCSADDHYTANVQVYYRNVDGQHRIEYLAWEITADPGYLLGQNSRIVARVKRDNSLGSDKIFYTYRSQGNVKPGTGYLTFNDPVAIAAKDRMYVEYTVSFDRPGKSPVKCVAKTANV